MPLVSIIIPTYNSEKNIKVLLQSLLESENKDFEIIINDDLRTNDRTEEIIKNFSNVINIQYIKENKRMAQARKKGAQYAKGSILFHMDSDMKVTPGLRDSVRNGQNGLLVTDGDFTAMGEKFIELVKNPMEHKKLAESSLQFIKCFGGWDERYQEFKKIILK